MQTIAILQSGDLYAYAVKVIPLALIVWFIHEIIKHYGWAFLIRSTLDELDKIRSSFTHFVGNCIDDFFALWRKIKQGRKDIDTF
jgi:hypothetical protein